MTSDAPPGDAPGAASDPASRPIGPRFLARLGLAITEPRWALATAADRANAGRSGSDLIAVIALVLAATQLRGLASAVWLGISVGAGFGLRVAVGVLGGALGLPVTLFVLGALVVFMLSGPRRNLGRSFDLACVAALPLLFINLVVTVVVRAAGIEAIPGIVSVVVSALSLGWMGALLALALRPARIAPVRVPAPPAPVVRRARKVAWALLAVVALGVAVQAVWISNNLELVKPMHTGEPAPELAIAEIDATGQPGARVMLASTRGKVTVLDFWATWCKPCLVSMPRLEQLAHASPDVVVLAINLDDAVAARALFDQRGYKMRLLAGNDDLSERYGVSSIPHTVIIDRHGVVREVIRGTGSDLAALVETIRRED